MFARHIKRILLHFQRHEIFQEHIGDEIGKKHADECPHQQRRGDGLGCRAAGDRRHRGAGGSGGALTHHPTDLIPRIGDQENTHHSHDGTPGSEVGTVEATGRLSHQ